MKSLSPSEQHTLYQHMYGDCGEYIVACLSWIQSHCFPTVDTSKIRVLLAPDEMSAYNRFSGYAAPRSGYILLNRHLTELTDDGIAINDHQQFFYTLVHEVAHLRQAQLLAENYGKPGWKQHRGHHRDRGWWFAIAKAFPALFGRELPENRMPILTSRRNGTGTNPVPVIRDGAIEETTLCHFPRINPQVLQSLPLKEGLILQRPYTPAASI